MKRFAVITISLFISLSIGLSISAAQYDPEVYQAQKALKERGYNPGRPDGLWGMSTESAIKNFQVDNELPVTEKLDEETKAKLGMVSSDRSVKSKSQTDEQRIALVIGNSAYQYAPLKNPQNDAVDMASSLNNLGFKVTKKLNASRREIEEAINGFGRELRKGGVGLFYFAGHGVQVNGINYLIPIGVNIESEGDVKYEAVNANRVLSKMQDAGNPLNLVFLDACRNNPFARRFRSAEQGLAPMDAPKGSFVAYATAPGDVAAEGDGRNGIFTKYILQYMREPALEIAQMMRKVRAEVQNDTDGKQTPFEVSSLTGNFYFAFGVPSEVQTSTQLADERAKLERERKELERLKLEIERRKLEAERKRIEEEQKKKTVVASIDPKDREIGSDGHYIAYANGIVRDTKTGLDWIAGPDKETDWFEAKQWVENLTVAGGGWRMPTLNELKTLYQKGLGTRNMTPLLKTIGWWVWSGETKGSSSARLFPFSSGGRSLGNRDSFADNRVFAVRSLLKKQTLSSGPKQQDEGEAFNEKMRESEKQQEQKETPQYASISPEVTKSEIARGGRFIAYDNGTVKDTKTGLMWAAKDNGGEIKWRDAKRYCENYRGGGYTDWRMPTLDELAGLYDRSKSYKPTQSIYNVHLTELIKLSKCCMWASETRIFYAANFSFQGGDRYWTEWFFDSHYNRALPVRSGK